MANLAIIDTGYLNVLDTGSQAPDIVNSSTAITLKASKLNYSVKSNSDSSEIVNSRGNPVVGFGTTSAPKVIVSGVLSRLVSADMTTLALLRNLPSTYGVKLLYYSDTTDGYRDITDSLGTTILGTDNSNDVHKTTNFAGTATPHLHVRFTSFQVEQLSSTHLKYTLEGMETE